MRPAGTRGDRDEMPPRGTRRRRERPWSRDRRAPPASRSRGRCRARAGRRRGRPPRARRGGPACRRCSPRGRGATRRAGPGRTHRARARSPAAGAGERDAHLEQSLERGPLADLGAEDGHLAGCGRGRLGQSGQGTAVRGWRRRAAATPTRPARRPARCRAPARTAAAYGVRASRDTTRGPSAALDAGRRSRRSSRCRRRRRGRAAGSTARSPESTAGSQRAPLWLTRSAVTFTRGQPRGWAHGHRPGGASAQTARFLSLRRSRSERPPQMPKRSSFCRAYSRQSPPHVAGQAHALRLAGGTTLLREERLGVGLGAQGALLPTALVQVPLEQIQLSHSLPLRPPRP